jgi:hypothetical protein
MRFDTPALVEFEEAMTYRRFPAPCAPTRSRAAISSANGQALMHIYSRDSEAEALQAKVLTKDEARRIAPTSRGCRSCLARVSARREWVE